jgi:4-amino-4-deoxy-L-arabinose transferase-like glycosyltransferase
MIFLDHMDETQQRILRGILCILALVIMFLPVADFIVSGDVEIADAHLKNISDKHTGSPSLLDIHVSLPYSVNTLAKGDQSYEVTFTTPSGFIDPYRTIEFVSYGCTAGSVNDQGDVFPIERKSLTCNRDNSNSSTLTSTELGTQITKILNVKSNIVEKFSIVRQMMFDSLKTFLTELLGIYLLGIALIRNRVTFHQFNYAFWVLGFFAFTSMPLFDTDKNNFKTYVGYVAQWITIPTLMACSMKFKMIRDLFACTGKLFARIRSVPARIFVPFCMLLFFGMALSFSYIAFDYLPHVADSYAQYVHAKIMATGHWYATSHPFKEFFDFQNFYNEGKYYSHYPPGHIMLLAIGQFLGVPAWVNPVLGALTVGAIYLLTCELAGKTAGYIATALTLICPFMVFMSSEYMNHATALLFVTLALYGYIRFLKTGKRRFGCMAALCFGYAFISRPQTLIFFAFPIAVHAAIRFIRQPTKKISSFVLLGLFLITPATFFLYYNQMTTGDPLRPNQGESALEYVASFVNNYQWPNIYQEVRNIIIQSNQLHIHLFGWTTSSLLFVGVLFLFRAQPKYASLLMACCIAQFLGLLLVPFFDMIFGPRYLYETSGCFIALTAIGLQRLPAILYKLFRIKFPLREQQGAIALMVILLSSLGIPFAIRDKYGWYRTDYWEGNASYYHAVMDNVQKPALVFIKDYDEYRMLFSTQPPRDDNPVIVARDLGGHDQVLIDFYPTRTVYRFYGGMLERIK